MTFSTTSKDTLHDEKGDRGPLPDVPDGYANYIVGDQSLYVEPYLKQSGGDPQSYEAFEKPVWTYDIYSYILMSSNEQNSFNLKHLVWLSKDEVLYYIWKLGK